MDGIEGRGEKKLALIVDDEPFMRAILRGTLEEGGYDVIEAASGEEALRLVPESLREGALALGLAVVLYRGDRLAGTEVGPAARDWPRGGLAAALAAVVVLDCITVSNMDLAVKVRLAALQAEAASFAREVRRMQIEALDALAGVDGHEGDEDDREILVDKGRRRAAEFTWQRTAERTASVDRELL